jgi:hypothetical protein
VSTNARAHDLPPLWDGRPVQWSDWTDEAGLAGRTTLVFHVPADHWACTGCGWIRDSELRAVGTLLPGGGVTDMWPHVRLVVRRCPGCHLDEVTDIDTGEVWDLEDTDYTDAGSWPDDIPTQGTLF